MAAILPSSTLAQPLIHEARSLTSSMRLRSSLAAAESSMRTKRRPTIWLKACINLRDI